MANFQRGKGDLAGIASALNDGYAATAPVRSYPPNDFGLYDMAGNVNEWVLDVYRPLTFEDMDEYAPFRGNVYTEPARDDQGNLLPKDNLGRIQRDTITDAKGRYNYQIGDNRNFRDGDFFSSIDGVLGDETTKNDRGSNRMYNSQGTGEDRKGMTTLISDKSRVYKGGSFRDRAYWLSPGTRRYLEESMAAVDIGFRCAMDVLGTPEEATQKRKR